MKPYVFTQYGIFGDFLAFIKFSLWALRLMVFTRQKPYLIYIVEPYTKKGSMTIRTWRANNLDQRIENIFLAAQLKGMKSRKVVYKSDIKAKIKTLLK